MPRGSAERLLVSHAGSPPPVPADPPPQAPSTPQGAAPPVPDMSSSLAKMGGQRAAAVRELSQHLERNGIGEYGRDELADNLLKDGCNSGAIFDTLSLEELADDYGFGKLHIRTIRQHREAQAAKNPHAPTRQAGRTPTEPEPQTADAEPIDAEEVEVKAKIVEGDDETEVSLKLSRRGLRVTEQATGIGSFFGCAAAPGGGTPLHSWTTAQLRDIKKTADDLGVEVTVQADEGERKFQFVTRRGNKKKQANLTLCLAWKQYALPRHYEAKAAEAQKQYADQLKFTTRRLEREKKEAVEAAETANKHEREQNAKQAAELEGKKKKLFDAAHTGMANYNYAAVAGAMGEILSIAGKEEVHPKQREVITKQHAAEREKIEAKASALGDSASARLDELVKQTARETQLNQLANEQNYKKLGEQLIGLLGMKTHLNGVMSETAYSELDKKCGDLAAQLDAHLTDLVQKASDEQASPTSVAGFVDRLECICRFATGDHVPDGSEEPSARLAALWGQFENNLTKLCDECTPLTQSADAAASLLRTSTRRNMEDVDVLARKLALLDEFREALGKLHGTAEEGVPGHAGLLVSSGDLATSVIAKPAGSAHAKRLHEMVRGRLDELKERLKTMCGALRGTGEPLTDEGCDSETQSVEFEQTLKKLKLYAETVDDKFTDGCFRSAYDELARAANKFLADKIAAFDASLSSGQAEEAEAILKMVEQVGTVSILEEVADKALPGMQRRMADENDDTEEKARAMFEDSDFAGLKDFLLELKAADPDSTKFKTFGKLQTDFVSRLKKKYTKAKRELDDPTAEGVDKLIECMQALTAAQPLEDCIEGSGYSGWRLDLQASVQRVCNKLKGDTLGHVQAWQLSAAEKEIAHLQLYTKCPDVENVDGALADAIKAKDDQMASLQGAVGDALGTQGTDPQPQQLDTIVKGLREAGDTGGGAYSAGLAESTAAIQKVVEEHDRKWKASLHIADVEGAEKVFKRLKALSVSKTVDALIKEETDIDMSLNRRRLEEAKEKVLSRKHLKDATPEALDKSLAGLKRVDPLVFDSRLATLIGESSQIKEKLTVDLGGAAALSERLFQSLRQEIDDLYKFQTVLQAHGDVAQLRAFRQDLLSAWVRCVDMLCGDPQALRDVTDQVTCIKGCTLDADERADVEAAIKRFDEASRKNGALVEKMIRVFQDVIMQIDCSEPTTMEDVDSVAECLRNLESDGALIPPENAGVSNDKAVEHLSKTIRSARDKALAAGEEDYRLVAQCADGISKLVEVTAGGIDRKAQEALDKVNAQVTNQLKDLYERGERKFASSDFQEVNEVMESLKSARKQLKSVAEFNKALRDYTVDKLVDKMKDGVKDKTKAFMDEMQQMEGNVDVAKVAQYLLDLYQVPSEINSKALTEEATRCMDALLKEAEKKENSLSGKKFSFDDLANKLDDDEGGKGGEIIEAVPAFQSWMRERFNQATAGASPEKSIPEIVKLNDFSPQQKAKLESCWAAYDKKYNSMLHDHARNTDVEAMVKEATADLSNVVETIAGICAVWSLAGLSPDEDSVSIIRPHCCQILSILVLLGLHDGAEISPEGHLIQVKTGQGKSVLLGVLATLLAVKDFDVDCVCYSKYLSSRDEASFAAVFDAFKVRDRVNYDTFNGLAEASINAKGDVRKLTTEVLVDRGAASDLPAPAEREKILLIDEVDVFFSDAFYGATYSPVTPFRTPNTDQLQKLIWDEREVLREGDTGAAKLINLAKKSEAFKEMVRIRPHLRKIFDGHVRLMVRDVGKVLEGDLTLPYEVVPPAGAEEDEEDLDGAEPEPEPEAYDLLRGSTMMERWKIGHVDQDSINTDMAVGYETLFCYFAEQQKYNDRDSSAHPMDLAHASGLRISCGEFSFAEMGRAGEGKNYARILGVSGTLKCLGDFEQRIIKDTYDIRKMSDAPSIFGENRMRFNRQNDKRDDYVSFVNDLENFHQTIQLDVSGRQTEVAVIVFFETDARLQAYLDYLDDRGIQRRNLFAVTGDIDNIDHYVKQATRLGNATLFSRVHGRGLDFKCHNKSVESNGGMHVVQTFLSEEESEEIQIRGRSARQEKSGTYKLILLRSDLEKFGIGADDQVSYEILDAKRKAYTDRRVGEREETVQKALERHEQSMAFAKQLRSADFDSGMEFLNAPFQGGEKSVLFLLDYSGSMAGGRIKASIKAIQEVFDDHIDDDDHVALTYFNSEIKHLLPWTGKEGNEAEFLRLFESPQGDRIGDKTPYQRTMLWGAVEEALKKAADAPSAYWIVLLTDGDDTDSKGAGRSPGAGFDEASQAKHATAMKAYFREDLLPAVKRCSDQQKLGGMVAIAFGNDVNEETRGMLGQLAATAGVEDGMIPAGSAEKLKEAFSRAAAIMGETKVTH